MGKSYDAIDDRLQRFIAEQHVFFVASAPREGGHVNLSPKGVTGLKVIGPDEVAYPDMIGSGAETIAHLRENGRITLLFCSFSGPPLLLRLYGKGRVLEPGDEGFAELAAHFADQGNTRALIHVKVERISDSCGYGVPLYQYEGERPQFDEWTRAKGPEGLRRYQLKHNMESIDGLPALRGAALGAEGEDT